MKIISIDQNYVPKNISIIQNIKSPFNFPFFKGENKKRVILKAKTNPFHIKN